MAYAVAMDGGGSKVVDTTVNIAKSTGIIDSKTADSVKNTISTTGNSVKTSVADTTKMINSKIVSGIEAAYSKKYINKAIKNVNQDTLADMAYNAYKNGGVIYQNSTYYEGNTSNAKALEYYKAALEVSKKVKHLAINKLNSNVYYCMAHILFTEAQYGMPQI